MDEKSENQTATRKDTDRRAPYVRPELVLLGDVVELTRNSSGSVADGVKGGGMTSSIQFKKDVEYLDDRARDEVMRDLLSLRLATWEYSLPERAGQRYLGFIIEDSPGVAAVQPGKKSIDLYTYASMAVAAAQVQAREIDELRAEVSALREELRALKK